MKVNGKFEVHCNNCDKTHLFSAEEAFFDCIESAERGMGDEKHYEWTTSLLCDCGNDIEIEYGVWEYPEGGFNHKEININGCKAIQEFNYDFCC